MIGSLPVERAAVRAGQDRLLFYKDQVPHQRGGDRAAQNRSAAGRTSTGPPRPARRERDVFAMRAKELPARTLRDLRPGQSGRVGEVGGSGPLRTRLLELGLTPGVRVLVKKVAPFGDPIEISLRGYVLSLRKSQAQEITLAGR